MGLLLKRIRRDSHFTPGQQLSALWLFKAFAGASRHELRSLFQHVSCPLCFCQREWLQMKRMKRKVGRIQGIALIFMIYCFLLCCLQNPGQNVLPGWMGLRELVHSCFFLPLWVFLPCSFLPLALFFARSHQTSQPHGSEAAERRLRQGGTLAAPDVPWGPRSPPAAHPGQE